ncbi:MAG: DNA-binding protein [Nakamurella sp.]
MSTVPEVLARHGIALTESDVAAELDRAFRALPAAGAAALTAGERDYLTDHAGNQSAQAIADWDPQVERQRRAAVAATGIEHLIASTLSIDQAAQAIGVDRSRISHRRTSGTLYSVTVGGRRRIPAWQIRDGQELPGLAQVVAAIPTGTHPLDIEAIMTNSQDELAGRTPVEHLAGGGDPAPVTDILAALDLW